MRGEPAGLALALAAGAWALAAAAAASTPMGGAGAAIDPADLPGAQLPGRWYTYANADEVTAVAADGDVVWAGSRAGGLVRWPAGDGDPVQYLSPQSPIGGNTVHDLAVDGQGRLWIATSGGLSVLDDGGTASRGDDAWRTYTVASTFGGLPSDDVRAVAVDGATVWVGAAQEWDPASGWGGGGLGHLDTRGTEATEDDIWAPVATFEGTQQSAPDGSVALGLVSNNINALAVAPGGGVWIAAGPQWRLEQPANPEKGAEWHPAHGGLSHLDPAGTLDTADDTWRPYSCEDPLQDSEGRPLVACNMADLDLDGQGRMWTAAGGLGVVAFPAEGGQLTPGVVHRFQGGGGLDAGFVEAVAAPDFGNTVWLATRSAGVLSLDPGPSLRDVRDDVWRRYGVDRGLPGLRAQALALGPGVVWVGLGPEKGTGQGLARLDPAAGRVTGHLVTAGNRGPPSNFVTTLAFGAPGTPWAGHVFVGTGSRVQRTFGAGLADLDTASTASGADDVWTTYSTVATDDDGKAPFTGLVGDNVQAVAVDGEYVWVGSAESVWNGQRRGYDDGGVSVFDGVRWTARTVASTGGAEAGLRSGGVAAMAMGCDGALWIGSGTPWAAGTGVDVLVARAAPHDPEKDTWGRFAFPDLASDEVAAVAADCPRAAMWVGSRDHSLNGDWSDGGLARYAAATGAWSRFDAADGLESYSAGRIRGEALSVAVAPDGGVWVGSFGTRRMTQEELIARAPYWPAVVNRFADGRWSNTVFKGLGRISALALDADGTLWAATTRGGAARESVDPENWRSDRRLPGIVIWTEGQGWRGLDEHTGGLPANDISFIGVDADGAVWVATEGWGLAVYRPEEAPSTATPTTDAPSPTPGPEVTATPSPPAPATPGSTASATASGTAAPGTPSATRPPPRHWIYLPVVYQLRGASPLF